jgi:hypothetical protein
VERRWGVISTFKACILERVRRRRVD